VREFALQGAEVLANPSNDSWFGHATPARQQGAYQLLGTQAAS
jgi:apolipoprotein N-acyltransferase